MGAVMQPTGREVSREGYDDVRRSGRLGRQQQVILAALRMKGPSTRQQIHDATELALASVCGRCKELLDSGQIEVVGPEGRPARQVLAIAEEEKEGAEQ